MCVCVCVCVHISMCAEYYFEGSSDTQMGLKQYWRD